MIRPVLNADVLSKSLDRDSQEGLLQDGTDMRMLRWILGVSLKDTKRNEVIRKTLGVECVTDKTRSARLRWYGHVMRREDENYEKIIMKCRGQRGRQ